MADLETLKGLALRFSRARSPNRRLDYELFCVFSPSNEGGFWDPQEGNEFTSTGPMRHCARLALSALIAQAEQGLPMADKRACRICGETDPYPASLCLAKLSGCAERDKPCQYSVEGQARFAASMEVAAEQGIAAFKAAAAHGAKIREGDHGA